VVVVSPVTGRSHERRAPHLLALPHRATVITRSTAIDRTQPVLKEIREAPLEFRYRSDTLALTIECLIKAIEARTMDTGIPVFKIPAGIDRSDVAAL